MSPRMMTDGTLQFLRESVANGGRSTRDRGAGSQRRALMARDYMTHDGVVTDLGRLAAVEEPAKSVLPCVKCGGPVRCLHAIPIGDEHCKSCLSRSKSSKSRRDSNAQDDAYHGARGEDV